MLNVFDTGVIFISKSMRNNKYLKILNMSYNQIGNLGGKFIGKELKSNNSLLELYLYDTNICDKIINMIRLSIRVGK